MQESNTAIVRRVIEIIWNEGDLDLADHLFAANYVNHGGLISDLLRGPEAIKLSVALYRTAFPALHLTVDVLSADDDMVEIRWIAESSSKEVQDRPEQSTPAHQVTGATRSTLADGRIIESWTEWDHVNLLKHLTAVPLKTQA